MRASEASRDGTSDSISASGARLLLPPMTRALAAFSADTTASAVSSSPDGPGKGKGMHTAGHRRCFGAGGLGTCVDAMQWAFAERGRGAGAPSLGYLDIGKPKSPIEQAVVSGRVSSVSMASDSCICSKGPHRSTNSKVFGSEAEADRVVDRPLAEYRGHVHCMGMRADMAGDA
eukprot:350019-Chlamydomonas_euryale.AAC.2